MIINHKKAPQLITLLDSASNVQILNVLTVFSWAQNKPNAAAELSKESLGDT